MVKKKLTMEKTNENQDNKVNFQTMTVIIRSGFKEDGKYHPQIFLDKCLYTSTTYTYPIWATIPRFPRVWVIKMLQYERIDVSEGIDTNKTSASKEKYALSLLVF